MNYTTAFVLRHAGHAPLRKVARCPLFPKMARWATVFSGILRIMVPLRKNVLSLKMCSKGKRRHPVLKEEQDPRLAPFTSTVYGKKIALQRPFS